MSTGDWGMLSPEQQRDVNALRDRIGARLAAETEAFYVQHPELKLLLTACSLSPLTWNFMCDVLIRKQEPKYTSKDRVRCLAQGVSFVGVIEQVGPDGVYHVEAEVERGRTTPLFVQEDEIIGLVEMI